jgi:hypothetical protein
MTEEEFDDYRDMRNPNGHPDRIKGNMVSPPQRCEHYHVCWFQHTNHRCINDNPKDIPCIFDTCKGVNFTVYFGRGDVALTEIEIALRKEETPSENVQWAIERINRLQEEWDASHSSALTEPQCLCETCCMTVEQCRGVQLRQAPIKQLLEYLGELVSDSVSDARKREIVEEFRKQDGE